jgi:hypothetical protein
MGKANNAKNTAPWSVSKSLDQDDVAFPLYSLRCRGILGSELCAYPLSGLLSVLAEN